MRLLRVFRQRVRSLFRSAKLDAELERELAYHLEELTRENIALGLLLKRDGATYKTAFTLLPAEDVRLVRARAEAHARALADSLLARRAEIDAALASYDVPGVDRRDVAFIVLGCFSLDWDGLKLCGRPRGKYVPWAEERIPEAFPLYCYSTSWARGRAGVVSFGDGRGPAEPLLQVWKNARDAAALGTRLFAMREGRDAPGSTLSLPRALDFPILSQRDRALVSSLRGFGREAMASWLDRNKSSLKTELAGIAPLRAGVPYDEVLIWIWHYIFGRANAMLVEAGVFPDRGHVTAVFDTSLVK